MLAYSSYQLVSGRFQLNNLQMLVQTVGVVYLFLGIVAWYMGAGLRKGDVTDNASMMG